MIVEITPNAFSYLALAAFFPIAMVLFHYIRPTLALPLTVVLGVALLPELVVLGDLPALPPADKTFVISTSVLVACLVHCRPALVAEVRSRPFLVVAALLPLLVVGTFVTNRDAQAFGPLVLPGLQWTEVPANLCRDAFLLFIPFFAARAVIRTPSGLRDLLWVVVAAAIVYSPLVLFEIRMSPQLHYWVYGFAQQPFLQAVRGDLWRPFVFMRHGLALTLFLAAALVLATGMARARLDVLRVTPWLWAAFLVVVLVLCRSLASLLYGCSFFVLMSFSRGGVVRRLGVVLAVTALAFPVLRAAHVFPTERLVSLASRFSEERAESLAFRFRNEDILTERALRRPLFGWGAFGRSRVYDDYGGDISTSDGFWVIWLGERGTLGFLLVFGMITAPVFAAFRRLPRVGHPRARVLVEALVLVVAFHVVDLLPNGLFSPLNFFFAGALSGVLRPSPHPPHATRGRTPGGPR